MSLSFSPTKLRKIESRTKKFRRIGRNLFLFVPRRSNLTHRVTVTKNFLTFAKLRENFVGGRGVQAASRAQNPASTVPPPDSQMTGSEEERIA